MNLCGKFKTRTSWIALQKIDQSFITSQKNNCCVRQMIDYKINHSLSFFFNINWEIHWNIVNSNSNESLKSKHKTHNEKHRIHKNKA